MNAPRRTAVSVWFDGTDISASMEQYLTSLSYTDNEEGESDDLQMSIHDRDGIWLQQWIGQLIHGTVSSGTTPETNTQFAVGQSIVANGKPQYSSYGTGTAGGAVTNYHGKITQLNESAGIPYPIHVGSLGWFGESQVSVEGQTGTSAPTASPVKIKATITQHNWHKDNHKLSLPCGVFELDTIDVSGPPSTVTIKAIALPFSSQIRQTKKTRGWEACMLSGIAKEMANTNGMDCIFESIIDPLYQHLEQYQTSDIAFLSQLCENAGISLKATNNTLVLFDQISYEQKPAVHTIAYGSKGDYTKYKFTMGKADTQYASCRVSYMDPSNGQTITATAKVDDYDKDSENNQQLEITAKVSTIAQAQSLATSQLRKSNKFAKTASFTLVGNPNIVAGVTVMVTGFGIWDGKYLVSQAKHAVGGSGYTTQLKLRHVLEGY